MKCVDRFGNLSGCLWGAEHKARYVEKVFAARDLAEVCGQQRGVWEGCLDYRGRLQHAGATRLVGSFAENADARDLQRPLFGYLRALGLEEQNEKRCGSGDRDCFVFDRGYIHIPRQLRAAFVERLCEEGAVTSGEAVFSECNTDGLDRVFLLKAQVDPNSSSGRYISALRNPEGNRARFDLHTRR